MILRSKILALLIGFVCLFGGISLAEQAKAKKSVEAEPLTIGEAEVIRIEPDRENIQLNARIDTGATTSSLSAVGIVRFERDGAPWVRFKVHDPVSGELVEFSRKIEKTISIKRHGTDSQKRFVVNIWSQIGPLKLKRSFSLTDRTDFKFPVLIGRNFLTGTAIVDVSLKYSQGKPAQEK